LHVDGEVDVRGTYTVIAVASLMNMLTSQLTIGVAEYVRSCQSYEGGFGGEPGSEAHGGYTFCAVATLRLLNEPIDRVSDLERWLCRRQMAVEGGFQGRTNKLVDVCYSFWQGCALQLVSEAQNQFDTTPCDPAALVKYILFCSQSSAGGFRDKPTTRPDYYHTCYCLSGLDLMHDPQSQRISPVFNILKKNVPSLAPTNIQ